MSRRGARMTTAATASPDPVPAATLIRQLAAELQAHAPFSRMSAADIETFVAASRQTYYAPGETVLQPADGPAPRLLFIRRGAVVARRGVGAGLAGVHYEAGDLFPAGAVAAARPVTSTYEAVEDLFCLEVDADTARELAARSAALADHLTRRVLQLLEISRAQLQAEQGAAALAEHSLEAPLARLPRKTPVSVPPGTPLIDVLRLMHDKRVGSMLVLDDAGRALAILTRHDVLERVALARPADDTPIERIATQPVLTLDIESSAQDAALAMARHGVRHLPLTEGGRVVSVVSERDLFALQRLSLRHVSATLREAGDLPALVAGAAQIRRFARHLLTQGLAARAVTEMLSHLNDLLTERLVRLTAAAHGLDLGRAAWLAFGSEGRSEQTIATDQDNGLVLADAVDDAERARWLAMAHEVNQGLDACGYPLCKGNVMAGNPELCLRQRQWMLRFERWMEQGAPEDLLKASIYFDLRALAGDATLAGPLRDLITRRARELPRFRKQLADNALRMRPALNWRGAIDATREGDAAWVDLKMGGTAVFVDAARLFALAQGVAATATRERLLACAAAMKVGESEARGWVDAFEWLQMLRLRRQVGDGLDDRPADQPNRVDLRRLGAIDERLLKEALRMARSLQQRIELDYAA
ncbi:MAG: CBS domain-containing protein [Rubrivivax sp.]|nr:CBS domain-containing protein [Rubrivivax sp.]